MKAIWNDQVIAESDNTVVVEDNHYFPEESLNKDFFVDSDHESTCWWKGVAKYKSIKVGEDVNTDAVWYYAEPKDEAKQIKGHYAFWKGVKIEE